MGTDFNAYQDPGVYIEELPTPLVSAVGIAPTILGLVGDTQRYGQYLETRQLLGSDPITLTKLGINVETIVVRDRFTGVIYEVDTDYEIDTSVGDDATPGTEDDVTTITRTLIDDGTYVNISYQYTDPTFYTARMFYDYDDIRVAYGDPFDSNGGINSPLTLAALIANANGVTMMVCAPVLADGENPSTNEWGEALDKLKDFPSVNVIVPITGSAAVHDLVESHVNLMEGFSQYRRGFIGREAGTADSALQDEAIGYGNSRMVVVGPSKVQFFEGNTDTVIDLGGQYAAVATAACHASREAHVPITRKKIAGLYGIFPQASEANMLASQRSGVTYLWQRRNGDVIVRHGLTTNVSNVYDREINVQAGKDRLRQLVTETLESQNLIGSVITRDTPHHVMGTVIGALELAMQTRMIFDYSAVKYRYPATNPTLIQIRFMYKPSLPLNYIQVQFSIDTDTGMAEFQTLTTTA